MIKRILTLSMLPLCILVAQELLPLVDFDSLERIGTDTRYAEPQAISLVTEGQTEGKGCVRVDINNGPSTQKNHYGMLRINLEKPIDLRGKALLVDIKALTPEYAQGLYVRCYNRGAEKPSISYQNWDSILKEQWTTLRIQDDFTLPRMKWEPKEVDGKPVDNIQVIHLYFASISQYANTRQSYLVDNLRLVPAIEPPSNVMPNKTRTPVALDLPPAPASGVIHPLDTLDDITFPPLSDKVPPSKVQVVDIDGGKAISLLGGLNPSHEGNQYHHIVINLRQPLNLEEAAVAFDARTDHPIETTGFYVRFYNRKSFKPSWSFSTWGSLIRPEWRTDRKSVV